MFELKKPGWGWGFVASAVLFNPVFPVYLDKSVWQIIDVAVAVFFFASFNAEKTESK
jgi:FtsH-binding integral membrane protein